MIPLAASNLGGLEVVRRAGFDPATFGITHLTRSPTLYRTELPPLSIDYFQQIETARQASLLTALFDYLLFKENMPPKREWFLLKDTMRNFGGGVCVVA